MIHNKEKVFGIAPYMAPELLGHNDSQSLPFSEKTDIYSLGMLLWEISSGYPPFKNYDSIAIICKVAGGKGEKEEKISGTPSDYYDIYTSCWNYNPEERPTIEDVYNKLESMLLENNEDK